MQHRIDLSKHRLSNAERMLSASKILLEAEDYGSVANRSYYCIYHAMRAVLALEELDFKKHSGVISHFRQQYIKSGKFSEAGTKLSKIIDKLFLVRTKSDYDDFFLIPKKEVTQQVENAEYFLKEIKSFLSKQGVC